MHYVFSGSIDPHALDIMMKDPEFEPIDMLVSQIDRTSVKIAISYIQKGAIKSLFIDSGAFTAYTKGISIDIDEYIEFVNSIDEYTFAVAELDVIAGQRGKPRSKEDFDKAAEASWNNYLYMYERMKSPEKLICAYHHGEDISYFKRMLNYVHSDGKPVSYIGLGGIIDLSSKDKCVLVQQLNEVIDHSNNKDVKLHLFAMTSLSALKQVKFYSADSTQHIHFAAYGTMYTREFGSLNLSTRSTGKRNSHFMYDADDSNKEKLKTLLSTYGLTIEDTIENRSARLAVSMNEIYKQFKDTIASGKEVNIVSMPKKLF